MSAWSSALNVVKTLAPTIATAIGGPLAGGAVMALESVFGITPTPNSSTDDRTNALAAAISGATPEQLASIRKADQDYALAMAQAGFKDTETLASLTVQDRGSARQMQMSTKGVAAPILAFVITIGFFVSIALVMFAPLQPAAHDAMMMLLGSLATAWAAVVAFYFGSSQDSHDKNQIIANQANGSAQ
jgi:hypothetical protein